MSARRHALTIAALMAGAASLIPTAAIAADAARPPVEEVKETAPSEDIVVTGSYTVRNRIDTATGLGLTVRETPQSVSIITAQRIRDQNLISIADVIRNGVGVTTTPIDDVRNSFFARGFEIRNYQVDSVPLPWTLAGGAGETIADVSLYERVEIVRGATGLLSGAGDPSASVNLVRKHADSRAFAGYVSASYGSWNTWRVSGDVGGALTADGRIRARAVGRYEQGDGFIDRYRNKKFVVYGVVDADLTDSTLVRAGISHQEGRPKGQAWGALPTFYSDGTVTDWPRSKSTSADWTYWNTTNQNIFATVRQDFGGGWTLTADYNRLKTAESTKLLYLYGTVNKATGTIEFSDPYKDHGVAIQNSFDAQLKGRIHLLGRDHDLVVGALHSIQNHYTDTFATSFFPTDVQFANATGSTFPSPIFSTTPDRQVVERIKQTGYYGALRLNLTDELKIIGGGRLASWRQTGFSYGVTENYGNKNEFIPYVGALYDLTPHHRLYASFTRIFQPQNAVDSSLKQLAPLDGTSYEIGLKSGFFNDALQTSIALFEIKQDNLAQPGAVIIAPGGLPQQTYFAAKGTTSKGFETEVTGSPVAGWNLNFGFSRFWIKDGNGNPVNTDQPRALVKLFTTYDLTDKLTLGGGANYRSKTYSSGVNPVTNGAFRFQQGGYTLVSLMTRYALTEHLQLQANLENLLNKKYYAQTGFYSQYRYGEPRNFTISANYKF